MGLLHSTFDGLDGVLFPHGHYPLGSGESECWLLGRNFVVEIQLPDNALKL